MSGLAVRNLKTAELRSSYLEFAETLDKAAACQKIFRIFERTLRAESLVYKDRSELRSAFGPSFQYAAELYPIAAYQAALIGLKRPYFLIYGKRVEQGENVTQATLKLIERFRSVRDADVVTASDLLDFDAAWDAFEVSYLTRMKASIEGGKEHFRQMGKEEIDRFFERISELIPYCQLDYAAYAAAAQLPDSHILASLAKDIVTSVKTLRDRFENFSESFSVEFPVELLAEIRACQKTLEVFNRLNANPFKQKVIAAMILAARNHPELISVDSFDSQSAVLLPKLGAYYLWQTLDAKERAAYMGSANQDLKADAEVFALLVENQVDIPSVNSLELAKVLNTFAYQMHSEAAEELSQAFQIVCRLLAR
ncbi:MAG TPA: hypothetical protein VIJ46_07380 [Rhabdochlamydiaceae bacterium]